MSYLSDRHDVEVGLVDDALELGSVHQGHGCQVDGLQRERRLKAGCERWSVGEEFVDIDMPILTVDLQHWDPG